MILRIKNFYVKINLSHLTDGEYKNSGSNSHLAHNFIRENTSSYNANTSNNNGNGEQPPAKINLRVVRLIIEIAVVSETQTT